MATCRSCGSEILWGLTQNGKPMPLDPDPVATGVVFMLGDGRCRKATDDDEPTRRFRPHWATCHDAARWRKGGKVNA